MHKINKYTESITLFLSPWPAKGFLLTLRDFLIDDFRMHSALGDIRYEMPEDSH